MRKLIKDEGFSSANARDYSLEYGTVQQRGEDGKKLWDNEAELMACVENKVDTAVFFVPLPGSVETFMKVSISAADIKKLYEEIKLIEAEKVAPEFWD